MSPSKKSSGSIENITISTENNTINTLPSPHLNQTYFPTTITTTIKYLPASFDNKYTKQKKSKETIFEQDTNFDAKFEKYLQTLPLQTKEDNKHI